MFLNTFLVAAGLMGTSNFRLHFHLLLLCLIVFGPALSMWVSQHSIFAKRTNFLHREFLHSGWGWTCIFVGLLSFSVHRSRFLLLRHLSRLVVGGVLWVGFQKLLENSTGSCYEPFSAVGGQWPPFSGGALGCLSWRVLYQNW
uniref:Uncharacterized protein n=1 Tax=Hucho hucho TaxID=62062 RepID=A0A4W5M2J9_9TELE